MTIRPVAFTPYAAIRAFVRRLADEARAELRERVDALLASEESRFADLLAAHATDPRDAEALERAAAAVEKAR